MIDNGQTITFSDASGATALQYTGLYVFDSTGATIPAHMALKDGGFSILVDDAKAVYPLTIDPLVQRQKIISADINTSDQFGTAVDISGDTAVFGAPQDDDNISGGNCTASSSVNTSGSVLCLYPVRRDQRYMDFAAEALRFRSDESGPPG